MSEKTQAAEAHDVVPDSFEPIVGIRAWRVTPTRMGLRTLRSTGVTEIWKPGVNHAACKRNAQFNMFSLWMAPKSETKIAPTDHAVPHRDCECGFWALSDALAIAGRDFTKNDEDHTPIVYGTVDLWGRVVCGSEGWRGEYARVTALIQRDKQARRVERQICAGYEVPLLAHVPALTPPLSGGAA